MLSPSLLSAVECDLAVARQLAYFYVGYSPDGEEIEVEAEQFVSGSLSGAATASHSPAANAVTHIGVTVSNPVPRPRQGTCAVLMELTRPLTWLSHRGRHCGPGNSGGGGGGSRATSSTVGASGGHGGSDATLNPSGAHNSNASAATATAAAGAAATTTSSSPYSAVLPSSLGNTLGAASLVGKGGGVSSHTAPLHASAPVAVNEGPPVLPLLVATVTLEVVFPARYPHEPCQWHLSEEVTFGGIGDHATSSWAVTTNHRTGSRSSAATQAASSPLSSGNSRAGEWSTGSPGAVSLGAEEGVPRRPISSRFLTAIAGENAGKTSSEDYTFCAGAVEGTAKLTAFVVPALGRRLLRWIAEARQRSSSSSSGGVASHARAYRSDVSPFLLDFACLLGCWNTVELDVQQLLLPSRIALAYGGGGGARLLRPMAGSASAVSGAASNLLSAASIVASTSVSGGGNSSGNNNNSSTATGAAATALGKAAERTGVNGKLAGNASLMGVASPILAAAAAAASSMASATNSTLNVNSGGNNNSSAAAASTATVPANLGVAAGGTSTAVTGTTAAGGPTASAGTGASALYPYRRRAVKPFLAVLLPLGDVAVCGSALAGGGGAAAATSVVGLGGVSGGGGGGGTNVTAAATRRANGSGSGACAAKTTVSLASAIRLDRVPVCLLPLYELAQRTGDGEPSPTQQQQQQRPDQSQRRLAAAPGTLLSCTSQFVRGRVLPSFLLPARLLGSAYKCEWDDVRFFTGKSADVALHANAKLAKAMRLPDVSNLFQVLRRLAKGVCTSNDGTLYLGEVLWPALIETVRVLRSARLPFWAGVAVCSLLLPSVLEQDDAQQRQRDGAAAGGFVSTSVHRGAVLLTSLTAVAQGQGELGAAALVRRWQRSFAELIQVVTYAERVLAVAQEYTLLCEARLVRCVLQREQQQLPLRSPSRSNAAVDEGKNASPHSKDEERDRQLNPPLQAASADEQTWASACAPLALPAEMCRRLHAPISVCAVCGLSLLRNTIKHTGVATTAAASVGRGEGTEVMAGRVSRAASPTAAAAKHAMVQSSLQARRAEGCLVVQCARCGHGGHVEHMSSWWNDPTVHCCPKGCDCICEY